MDGAALGILRQLLLIKTGRVKGPIQVFPSSGQVLQYIDDILVCAPVEEASQEGTEALLNFLADRAYKISKSKVQLCKTLVKYLGLVLLKGSEH